MRVSIDHGIPVGNALLTVRQTAHAIDRSRPGPGNKGAEAAMSTIEMINVLREIGK